jgi:hypothetical protein
MTMRVASLDDASLTKHYDAHVLPRREQGRWQFVTAGRARDTSEPERHQDCWLLSQY